MEAAGILFLLYRKMEHKNFQWCEEDSGLWSTEVWWTGHSFLDRRRNTGSTGRMRIPSRTGQQY